MMRYSAFGVGLVKRNSGRVIRSLNSQHPEYSYFVKTDMHISGPSYRNQSLTAAIKRHTAGSLLWDEGIQLVLVSNEKHELTRSDKRIIKGRPFGVGFDRSHQRLQQGAPS